jgi:hypothetical protein
MKFSQRKGYVAVRKVLQKNQVNDELRNSLWSVIDIMIWKSNYFVVHDSSRAYIYEFSRQLWFEYFKLPVDEIPYRQSDILKIIRDYFFKCEWYEIYDFLEFVLNYSNYQYPLKNEMIVNAINNILERELSSFRFVGGMFTDITDEQEIEMLEGVINSNDFPGVSAHLKRALELMSDRKNPDYRNSIKESISAVESVAKIIAENPKSTLGDALKVLERSKKIHVILKEGFSKIYGYTSDEGGIRHAMMEEPDLSIEDAKFFLLSCTSFVNYLKSKI